MLVAEVSADTIYDWDIVREGLRAGLAIEPEPERIGEANDIGQHEQTESKGHLCN